MILIQRNSVEEPRVEAFRKSITESLAAKGDHMTKVSVGVARFGSERAGVLIRPRRAAVRIDSVCRNP
jgi:hypothetical protein